MDTPESPVLVLNVQFPSSKRRGILGRLLVQAFADKDLSEEVALENARLARILQCTDYDVENQQPILWTPAADYQIDDGAGVQDASD